MERILEAERESEETFATLCDLEFDPAARIVQLRMAGHPTPLIVGHDDVLALPDGHGGPLLGVFEDATWPSTTIDLGEIWTLVVFTDGIIEGHDPDGHERFDSRALAHAAAATAPRMSPQRLADTLVAAAEEANGEPLTDDVALVIFSTASTVR